MRTRLLLKLPIIPAMALLAIFSSCCSSDSENSTDLKSFKEEVKREDRLTNEVMEANLDDDLNPTERRAVHPIFEGNQKAKDRMLDDVFQEPKK